jgi:peptide deformylase
MSILKVARMGHPVLRTRARPVEPPELRHPRIQQLIDDMIDTMREYQGIGLAAPQVHESLRIFVAGTEDDDRLPLVTIINPEITPIGRTVLEDWEGCLSVPDVRGRVPRAKDVTVRALDREGRRIELALRDYPARVIQHETDHLDGILFLDRMTSFESLTFLEEFGRFWSEERVVPE